MPAKKDNKKFATKTLGKQDHKMKVEKPRKSLKTGMCPDTIIKFGREWTKSMARAKAEAQVLQQSAAGAAPAKGWMFVGTGKMPDTKSAEVVPEMTLEMKALMGQLQFVKSTLASEYGTKPVPFRLPVTANFLTAATTGVVNSVLAIDMSTSPEFTYLAQLFDEYRFRSGVFEYAVITPTQTVVLATSSLTTECLCAIGFDPADAVPATNTRDVVQLEYHKQLAPRMVATPTVGTYVGVFGTQNNELFRFHWAYGDTAAITGSGGVVAPGMWKSTQGNVTTFPDGQIKAYYQSGETTAKNCIVGTMYWDTLFRCRT